jgi:hypothetical protein
MGSVTLPPPRIAAVELKELTTQNPKTAERPRKGAAAYSTELIDDADLTNSTIHHFTELRIPE